MLVDNLLYTSHAKLPAHEVLKLFNTYGALVDKAVAAEWFTYLRDKICLAFEKIEQENGSDSCFIVQKWERPEGGGGLMSIMHGEIFEKVGVNTSTVWGEFSDKFAKDIPGTENSREFYANGISIVAHMKSPMIPGIHMNTRLISTEKTWFGGGIDLTPTIVFEDDVNYFHDKLKEMCDKFNPKFYYQFKEECDRYFYLPHRQEPRGIGGIFFDYFNTGSWKNDLEFTQEVGNIFLEIFSEIIKRRINQKWNEQEKEMQLLKRSRYVEFNLLYDRGTKFGLMTGGNVDAIMMSMPPLAKWR